MPSQAKFEIAKSCYKIDINTKQIQIPKEHRIIKVIKSDIRVAKREVKYR